MSKYQFFLFCFLNNKNCKGEYILKEVVVKEFQIEKAVIEHKQQGASPQSSTQRLDGA